MAYVTKADLEKYLTKDQLERVTRMETTGVDYTAPAISEAENYIKQRLNYKYDMETELAKTDTSRDETLIRIICMVAIYTLTIPFDLLDQEGKYYQQYQRALEDIDKIEKGTLLSDYLVFQDEDKQQILFGTDADMDLNY